MPGEAGTRVSFKKLTNVIFTNNTNHYIFAPEQHIAARHSTNALKLLTASGAWNALSR